MSPDRLRKYMDSTKNVHRSMATHLSGKLVVKYSTSLHLRPLLMARSFACMVVSAQKSGRWIKFESLPEPKKFLTRELSATWCGVIQKTLIHGVYLLVELAGSSAKR
jgi:hypothetical protein